MMQYFDNGYRSDDTKADLFTRGLWKIIWIDFIKTGQRRIQDPFKHLLLVQDTF